MYQLEITQHLAASIYTEPNRKPGDLVWVKTEAAARHLLEAGLARWPLGTAPSNIQEGGPQERKSFGDRTDGPSTVSPLSKASGLATLASASVGALVRPQRL